MPGFCKSTTLSEIQAHNSVLTPGRYVGAEVEEEETEPFEETIANLTQELTEQMAEARRLDEGYREEFEDARFWR